MPVRDFAGGGVIRTALGTADPVGEFSYYALVRYIAGTEWMLARQNASHESAGNWQSFGREGTVIRTHPSDISSLVPPNEVWLLVGASKTAGSSKAIHSYYRFDTKELFSSESGSAFTAAYTGTPIEWQLGRWNSGEQFNGLYAAAMVCGTAFTASMTKTLAESASIFSWLKTATPLAMWMLNQKEVAEEVKDLTGNGANQISFVGTTVAAEEPPIPFFAVPTLISESRSFRGLVLR